MIHSNKKLVLYMLVFVIVFIAVLNRFVLPGFFMYNFSIFKAKDLILKKEEINPLIKAFNVMMDVHLEDVDYQHILSGNHINLHSLDDSERKRHIAIGGGITSASLYNITTENLFKKFTFFQVLLPSFCRTASKNYKYHFYLSFDVNDTVFTNENLLMAFVKAFDTQSRTTCRHVKTYLHLVKCDHYKKPAWAQNDAMMEAYLDGIEYFYRVNDDSILITPGWTSAFINRLSQFSPPNVGVVGPNHHGGNLRILTYDFVHKTHVDIFGYYYPRLFTDWFADNWITEVYKPDHMNKLPGIRLSHTMSLGRRYGLDISVEKNVADQIKIDKDTLSKYINYRHRSTVGKTNVSKVISLALYGNSPRMNIGAIRNAQLLPIYFPGWKLRVYTPNPQEIHPSNSSDNFDNKKKTTNIDQNSVATGDASKFLKFDPTPERVIHTLRRFDVEIVYVNLSQTNVPPFLWNYLVLNDTGVDYFAIRRPDFRISSREFEALEDFIAISNDSFNRKSTLNFTDGRLFAAGLHCVRDMSEHANLSIVPGLWAGNQKILTKLLAEFKLENILEEFFSKNNFWPFLSVNNRQRGGLNSIVGDLEYKFLDTVLWGNFREYFICHDSVTPPQSINRKSSMSIDFPLNSSLRNYLNIIGLRFNRHHLPDQLSWIEEIKSLSFNATKSS